MPKNYLPLPLSQILGGKPAGHALESRGIAPHSPDILRPLRFPAITDLAAESIQVVDFLRGFIDEDVIVDLHCEPCPGEIFLDSECLARILFKLMANAIEAMRADRNSERAKRISIVVRRSNGDSFLPQHLWQVGTTHSVLLSVRDNGPGIPLGRLPHILEYGYRDKSSWWQQVTRRDTSDDLLPEHLRGPRGRDLLVLRLIVDRAGGAVRVTSVPGFGARFDIEFPARSPM